MINVRTLPLHAIAQSLATPVIAQRGLRPLTDTLQTAFIRSALDEFPRAFRGLGHHQATIAAVAATLREFEGISDATLAEFATRSHHNSDLVAIERARRRLTTGYYSDIDVMRYALEAVEENARALDSVGHVLLYLPRSLRADALAVCDALHLRGRLSVIRARHGLSAAVSTDQITARLAIWFNPKPTASMLTSVTESISDTATASANVSRIVRAPDADGELRWIAHDLIARASAGLPLHRAAIAMRLEDPYRNIALQTLRMAGIAAAGASPKSLASSTTGRALLGLLDLVTDDTWSREIIMRWLHSAPMRDPLSDTRAPVTDWDSLSRRAGIVSGRDQWHDRLLTLASTEPRNHDSAFALRGFIATLITDTEVPGTGAGADATWTAWSEWLINLTTKYLGSPNVIRAWPASELVAHERILSEINALRDLDYTPCAPTLPLLIHLLDQRLAHSVERAGTFGNGVFVGTTDEIIGCAFDVVYIVGMAEGRYPPRGTEDPLLTDTDRIAFFHDAALQRDRAANELLTHQLAASTARELIVTFPCGDIREQRAYLPSPLVVAAARALADGPVRAETLLYIEAPWLAATDSLQHSFEKHGGLNRSELVAAALSADPTALRIHTHPIIANDRALAAGFSAMEARAATALSAYDGLVGPVVGPNVGPNVGPVVGLVANRPMSPTALEQWARCPFRYFLAHGLQLRELDRPETADGIAPNDLGELIHDILDRFITTADVPESPWAPWSNEDRRRLFAIAEERCADAVDRGITGRPLLWRLARRRIDHMLANFVLFDELHRAQRGVVPFHTELAFGFDQLSSAPPVRIDLPDGNALEFRGRIDRIDRAPGNKVLVVTDYKTGRVPQDWGGLDPVAAGRRLQLAVYALAAQRLAPGAHIEAYYWHLQQPETPEGWQDASIELVERRLTDVASHMFAGIESGQFPAVPGAPKWLFYSGEDSWEHCEHCPFDRVCPLDRDAAHDRKHQDVAFIHYDSLAIEPNDLDALKAEIEAAQ